ncbi:hypothetical protein ACWKWK_17390 [Pseudoxanthomonas beigongshangi]
MAWSRKTSGRDCACRIPGRIFSHELFAFTASRTFLRITDARARRAFGLTLVLTPVPIVLLAGFWIAST